MIYQLRIFTDHPGRVRAHVERFRDHTCRLLERHGVKIVGCWTCADETGGEHRRNQVVFMIAHESAEALCRSQEAFAEDPEVKAMVAASERDGPIILGREDWILQPAEFSPLR
jgi:predicted metal-binding protein